MALVFLIVLIGLPVMEIAVFIEAGDRIGLWPTVGAILATAAIGLAIIRMQGLTVLARMQENLRIERFPGNELFDGACLLVAGACLITPGFITDSIGFLLLIVPLRRLFGRLLWRYAERRGYTINTGDVDGDVIVDVEYDDITDRARKDPDRASADKRLAGPEVNDNDSRR